MAKIKGVWGIDVGQCALKALRCRPHEKEDRVIADAFDYIEYPKILSQPDADPEELVADALKEFLARNTVRGDKVAISASGQSGLARFIKLPPVESKKIPDIVRYEARQQIPFDLNDVIWDYQRMGVENEEEGFALETEIGLFAMKRDAVLNVLNPLMKQGIQVDVIQLTPLTLYNYAVFDQLRDLPPPEEYDPEHPPESVAMLSLGTDATDLVVTNGYRVWQRSIPIGGNHFTKRLTKELKLTFAKAEHLKRNATASQDPKAVFQAMRPVFNDLLTEVQRSLGYFGSIDRHAKIGRVLGLGNAMKLPGLRRYLSQSLGHEVIRVDEYRGLVGAEVLTSPAFRENLLSFPVCYGLALQGLGRASLRTNLLPREIVKDRMVREKKPWAVAAAAVLLLGFTISFAMLSSALSSVAPDAWQSAENESQRVSTKGQQFRDQKEAALQQFQAIRGIGDNLVGNVEGRILWLELLHAVNQCLPADEGEKDEDISQRNELHIRNLQCTYVPELSVWYAGVGKWDQSEEKAAAEKAAAAGTAPSGALPTGGMPAPGATPGAGTPGGGMPSMGGVSPMPPSPAAMTGAGGTPRANTGYGPSGPGWVIQLEGHHFHNLNEAGALNGAQFVRSKLIDNLRERKVVLPTGDRQAVESVSTKELGIGYPVLVNPQKIREVVLQNPNVQSEAPGGGPGRMGFGGEGGAASAEGSVPLRRFDFVVQFCWKPTTPTERKQQEEAREQAEAEAAAAAGMAPGMAPGVVPGGTRGRTLTPPTGP